MKQLGKIDVAEFGRVFDRDFLFGLKLCFKTGGGGVCDGLRYTLNMSGSCKWNDTQEKSKAVLSIMNYVYNLLKEAGVNNVSELKGIPVEIEFDGEGIGSQFKDFRILKEVL